MAEKELSKELDKAKAKQKARYWCGVLYPENMRADWQDDIGDLLGLPYAYCIHDKDKLEALEQDEKHDERKTHVHLMIMWSGPTTYSVACATFDKLSAPGKKCFAWIEQVQNVRSKYEYLIHNTETCKKKHKHLYAPSERITGNNFDIGSYEQLSQSEKDEMTHELCKLIIDNGITNFADFYVQAMTQLSKEHLLIVESKSGLFERLCKGCYQKYFTEQVQKVKAEYKQKDGADDEKK